MSTTDRLKFGIITGKTIDTSQPQTIDGYDLEYTTFKLSGLSDQTIDGAKIILRGHTPLQLVEKGVFRELVKSGAVRIDVTSNGQSCSYYPSPGDNLPVLVEEGSIMQITNLGSTPAEIVELSLPGFEKCILKNL